MRRLWTSTVALAVLCTVANAQMANSQKHPWAKWADGAWVQMTLKTGKTEASSTSTLTNLGKNAVTIKRDVKIGARSSTKTNTINFADGGFAHLIKNAKKLNGVQQLSINGKQYNCSVYKAKFKQNGNTIEESVWVCDSCNLPLKIVTREGRNWSKLRATNLTDSITIDGQKISCVKFEGKQGKHGMISTIRSWRSLDVPGGIVKEETSNKTGTNTRQVTKFHGRNR